ncbi:MAG: hypothetical protein JRJ62_14160 [Deltaproteobacteria bacterium]|nr:hypothetical protein [Deltaproteobacteria bacterium]
MTVKRLQRFPCTPIKTEAALQPRYPGLDPCTHPGEKPIPDELGRVHHQ